MKATHLPSCIGGCLYDRMEHKVTKTVLISCRFCPINLPSDASAFGQT